MTGGHFFKKTMADVPLINKNILLRADYNVPLTDDGQIADDFRIRSSLATVQALLTDGCTVTIISHLGRPDGKKDLQYTLQPVAKRLSELLGREVRFIDDCIGHKVFMATKKAPKGSVILLENLRFYPGEEANDPAFAQQLAKQTHADYFVQDGFGVVHRAHASTSAITQFLPSVAGLLLEREYSVITKAMKHPEKPLVAVLGGAKVSDKIPIIKALEHAADTIIVGGAMANTFLARRGNFMGSSHIEPDQAETIDAIYEAATQKVGRQNADNYIVLPTDVGVGTSLELTATRLDVSVKAIPAGSYALDIGPDSIARMESIIAKARTVIWNGPLGMDELPTFAQASTRLAQLLAGSPDITSIVGGGDTADFVIHWDPHHGESFSHVSTGGGASLELMAGEKLPGVEALLDA